MALIPVKLHSSGDWSTILVYQSTNVRWLINNHITWVTWLWLQVSGFQPGLSWIGRCLSKVFAHVILGGPIWPVPSLGLTGLVSAIPCTSLTLGGLSRTKVQVHDSIPSLWLCCADSTLRFVGFGAWGFLLWNCWTRRWVWFICEAGSQEFSEWGYPFHLIRYRIPFLFRDLLDWRTASTS